ncbi:MAG: hypothetical protein E6K81_09685, partial [Candidatus Eisenbacteria bacterium]
MNSTPKVHSAVYWVGPASKPDARDRGRAAACDFLHMIEFESGARLAAMAGLAHERTPAAVAFPDRALDRRRDVTRVGRPALAGPRVLGRRELLALELGDECLQRPLEDHRDVTRCDLMPEQLLRVAQQVVRLLVHGELDPEALGSQRRHPGTVADRRRGVLSDHEQRGRRAPFTGQRSVGHANWPHGQLTGTRPAATFRSCHANWPRGQLARRLDRLHQRRQVRSREALGQQLLDSGPG